MKLQAFTTLEAVLRTGSLTAAAREVNLTAGAVGLQMKQIEAFVGHPLFDRSGLQIRPLPLAAEVAAVMQRARLELSALRRPAQAAVEGLVEIGVIESMQAQLLPRVLQSLRQRHPGLRVVPHRGRSAELTSAVKSGALDAAVVAQPETGGSSRLAWLPLSRVPLSLVVPPNAPALTPAEYFARYEWIQYARDTIAGRQAVRYVHLHFQSVQRGLELDAVRAILAMVNAGLGLSVVQLSEPNICLPYPVQVVPLARAPMLSFAFVQRAGDSESRRINVVRDAVREAAGLSGLPVADTPSRAPGRSRPDG